MAIALSREKPKRRLREDDLSRRVSLRQGLWTEDLRTPPEQECSNGSLILLAVALWRTFLWGLSGCVPFQILKLSSRAKSKDLFFLRAKREEEKYEVLRLRYAPLRMTKDGHAPRHVHDSTSMKLLKVKTARFRVAVDQCGRPEVYTLWIKPKADKRFQMIVRNNRVMT